MALANYDVNQWSVTRDGLVSVNYKSNVRNESEDIRRRQTNRAQDEGIPLVEDEGQLYTVFNSDDKYNINEQLTANEVYELLTVVNIRQLLDTFRVFYNRGSRKQQLIQQLSNAVQQQPNRLNYVRQVYSDQSATQRRRAQGRERNVNASLLVSNQHRYSKSVFDGMKFKDILRSLFDVDYHLVFVYDKILKRAELPESRQSVLKQLTSKVENKMNSLANPTEQQRNEVADQIFEAASRRSDKILKDNAHIVLDMLFGPKRPFYVDKKLYTVLGYHQENGPTQDPEDGLVMQANPALYVNYPIDIYIELTEKPVDKITEKDIQGIGCHLRSEKIRKDWFDLWNSPPTQTGQYLRGVLGLQPAPDNSGKLFERKFKNTLRRRNVNNFGGGRKKRKTRRHKKKGGNPSPPAAIIEYLEYFPMQSKNQVDGFYEKIEDDWRQCANILQIFSKSAKQVNNIQQLLDAVQEAKTTTFCNRKTGDGDCEDTSDRVMELLPEIPGGKYTVESLRFEYSEQEDLDNYDETPAFVQNHGILIFYSTETKPWFKITESITYPLVN